MNPAINIGIATLCGILALTNGMRMAVDKGDRVAALAFLLNTAACAINVAVYAYQQ